MVLRASVLTLALPLIAAPAFAQVCHPAPVHHHHAVHARKVEHQAMGVGVVIDQARLVSFDAPVKTVFVGNPTIADISMVDPQHALVLGKTFGLTNLVALGKDGKQISNQQVVVSNNGAAVTVNRGGEQFDYMCTHAHCETDPRPGDPNAFVTGTQGAVTQHESMASAAAISSTGTSSASQTPQNQ